MYTRGFCSLRNKNGLWDGSGLRSADYVRDAAAEGIHEGLAGNRPAGRGGMQEAESEFWKRWPSQVTIDCTTDTETVEHVIPADQGAAGRPIRASASRAAAILIKDADADFVDESCVSA